MLLESNPEISTPIMAVEALADNNLLFAIADEAYNLEGHNFAESIFTLVYHKAVPDHNDSDADDESDGDE